MDVQRIRNASIQKARKLGVAVSPTLPLMDAELKLRSKNDSVARLLTMHAVAAAAYGFDRSKAVVWLGQETLLDSLSMSERDFLFEGTGRAEPFQDQVEGMWALAWALRIVDEMDFAKDCDSRFVTMLPNLKVSQSSAEFRNRARLRPLAQVAAACDLAFCLHWAIREVKQTGRSPPAGLQPDIVVERRRALEWMLSDEGWDEVSLDT